jgi:hypothetical protein
MPRHARIFCRLVTALLGVLLLLQPSAAHRVTTTLTATPVHGHLADGTRFDGWLTLHELLLDAAGDLTATGVLAGTATMSPAAASTVPSQPFTTLAAVLDLRGTCTTVVVDLAPIDLPGLAQAVTVRPIILSLREVALEAYPWYMALCALAHPQE